MLILGVISAKIIGLELFALLQISYFNLSNHGMANVNLFPLSAFKILNGFNILLVEEPLFSTNAQLSDINISGLFLNNFNIMGLICLSIILI